MTTIADQLSATHPAPVFGGVDTHADTHTAAVIDTSGRLLGNQQFPATPVGYAQLADWLAAHGQVQRVGLRARGSMAPASPATWPRAASSWSRSTAPTGRCAASPASPTRSMPKPPPGQL